MKFSSLISLSVLLASATLALAQAKKPDLNGDPRDLLTHLPEYIQDKESKLLINQVDTDVFGRPQDLKALERKSTQKTRVATKKSGPPINSILGALPLTLIDPVGDRVVLNGGPPLQAGEILEVSFGGGNVRLRLDGVRSSGAYFTNLDTGDRGLRPMTRLAKGIQRAGSRSNPSPGIQLENKTGTRRIQIDAPEMDFPEENSPSLGARPSGYID